MLHVRKEYTFGKVTMQTWPKKVDSCMQVRGITLRVIVAVTPLDCPLMLMIVIVYRHYLHFVYIMLVLVTLAMCLWLVRLEVMPEETLSSIHTECLLKIMVANCVCGWVTERRKQCFRSGSIHYK